MNVKITLPDVHKMRRVRTEWALSRVSVLKDLTEQTVFVQVIALFPHVAQFSRAFPACMECPLSRPLSTEGVYTIVEAQKRMNENLSGELFRVIWEFCLSTEWYIYRESVEWNMLPLEMTKISLSQPLKGCKHDFPD